MKLAMSIGLTILSFISSYIPSQVLAQSSESSSAEAPLRVTVLSYNIHHAEGVDGRLDLDRIAEVIRKSQADLVSLQEVDQRVARSERVDQPQELAKQLGMHVVFGANIDLQGGKYGNAVLSRYPIKSSKNHVLPNVGGGEQRGLLEVNVELPQGIELKFLATHLDHRHDPAQRLASAKFINELVDASEQPLCLVGDLNAVPDSSTIESLRQQWTLPTGQDQPTIPVGKPQRKIDYILHGQASTNVEFNIREVESRVLDEALASDHRPVVSVLEFTRKSQDRPNVLFIAIDDLNDWIGCLQGHPQALTPNMDALASRGVLFTNAHCSSPACNPSRAAVFSGRTPQYTGVWSNDSAQLLKQHPDILAIPRAFQRAGYSTLATGKMLHGGGPDNRMLFEQSFSTEQRWSPLNGKTVRYTKEELPSKGSENPRHVVEREGADPIVLPLNRMPSDRRPGTPEGESFDWGPLDVADTEMGDTKITDWAIEQLQQGFEGKPFFLGVGYYRPHIPLWAPSRYFEPFPLDAIQLPPYTQDDLDDLSSAGKQWALEAVTAGSHATVVKHDQWRNAVQAYLACTYYVDHELGRLIAALDSGSLGDNTLIVLWTDHGWHLGEKQHWGKWTGWERSTRVPLMIIPPKSQASQFASAGSRCERVVSLLDLYPTLLDFCNVPGPEGLDGQSLVPLLRDPKLDTDRYVLTTFDKGNVALRNERYRYIRYADGSEELYDHTVDALERYNLASQPGSAAVLEDLRKRSQ
ncbi:MAG: sulfatase-like hydrolase/transferase [Pirellulaceae bacterium]